MLAGTKKRREGNEGDVKPIASLMENLLRSIKVHGLKECSMSYFWVLRFKECFIEVMSQAFIFLNRDGFFDCG